MDSTQVLQLPALGSQTIPSPSGATAAVQQVHGVTIHDGNLTLVGGNPSIQNHYHTYNAEPKLNIVSALRLVRNLRKIHLDVLSKATPGTGVWLLRTDKFLLWLDINGTLKILWGTGIPGAGKTVMASIVINEVETRAVAAGGSICVCYVYFRYSDASDLTAREVLEILVKQTVERHPECMSLAEETYARHLHEGTEPTELELLQLLHQFTGRKSATFYILDALDEAPDKVQLELIKKLASLDVRLFITSRPLKGAESCVSGVHSLSIVAQGQDLELHINQEIQRSPGLQTLLKKAGPSLKEEIVTSIKEKSHGMFLHASLQLNALCECLSPGEVRRILEAFPSDIEDVYLQAWNRILKRNPTRVSLAKAVLVWVLNASRPMAIEELEHAVATSPETYKFEPDEVVPSMSLATLCRGLVTFEEESGVVRLVHYTAKGTLQRLLQESFPHPHSYLAAVCITRLAESGFQKTPIRSRDAFVAARQADPLLAYASDAWAFHSQQSLDVEDTQRRIANFIGEASAFPTFTSLDLLGFFDVLSPLHILSIYNLPMTLLANDDIGDPNVTTMIDQGSPLILASWHGHTRAVTFLTAHPKIQVNLVSREGWSALMLAARYGHEGIVALLLACMGIHVNLVSSEGWSALMLAARYGHEGIVKLLLACADIHVNLVTNKGASALMLAASYGCEHVAKLLLAHSEIQVNLADGKGWSALMLAANGGHDGIVQIILAHSDILVNSVDNEGRSALMLAAGHDHQCIVPLLLTCTNIHINLTCNNGWSALMVAAVHGHEGIVKVLLARSEIQVNLVDNKGWSALMKAAAHGHDGVFKLLLTCPDIHVNSVDNKGWSALILASGHGHAGIVKPLIAYPNVQVNLVTSKGASALMLAASNGCECIVKLLLACSDIHVNLVDDKGWSAFILAADSGHEGIISLLLAHSQIQVNLVSNRGSSALMLAAHHGHEGVAKLLLARSEIQVNSVDNKGWSALMKATNNGHEGIVKSLLAHSDIMVNLLSNTGYSALILAANLGHESIVRLLLDTSHINIMVKTTVVGRTAMSCALTNGHSGIVRLLEEFELRQTTTHSKDSRGVDTGELPLEKVIDEVMGRVSAECSRKSLVPEVAAATADDDDDDEQPNTTASKKRKAPPKAVKKPRKKRKVTS